MKPGGFPSTKCLMANRKFPQKKYTAGATKAYLGLFFADDGIHAPIKEMNAAGAARTA
jgi:hypothetical protein